MNKNISKGMALPTGVSDELEIVALVAEFKDGITIDDIARKLRMARYRVAKAVNWLKKQWVLWGAPIYDRHQTIGRPIELIKIREPHRITA